MRLLTWLAPVAIVSLLGVVACDDEDVPADDGSGTASGTGGGGGNGGNPGDSVPAEPLAGDLAVCPEPWGTTVPAEGQNDGYTVAGQDRSFWLMLPPASFTGPRPLFVAWNGTGETGQSFSSRAKLEAFTARGFIVLAPDDVGNGTVWPVWDAMHAPGDDVPDENPDLLLFDSLVVCAAGHMSIDKNRIYTGGHSAGGIMANYMLRHRSELFAGGIVASGVFSLTGPNEPSPLDEMMVIVTWGGKKDGYSGGAGEVDVPEINFVEQASLASLYYEEQPAVGQANCTADVGHAWLDAGNDWMIDLLLAHPKSLGSDNVVVEPTPEGSGVTCKLEPFEYEGGIVSECPTQTTVAGCDKSCQFVADCAVENGTVGPILGPQLTALGFSGDQNKVCDGCITKCESLATAPADAEVLGCMADAQAASICGPGIDGALPVIDALNVCCDTQLDSLYCAEVCAIFADSSAAGFLTVCEQFAPQD
jgi:predicted esterase